VYQDFSTDQGHESFKYNKQHKARLKNVNYFTTNVADVWFVASVDSNVDLQVEVPLERLPANGTAVNFVGRMTT
jgi:hypothetical protein